jgi:hypothetical protein
VPNEVYHSAAELGQWADEYRYVPTAADEREAAQLFGDLEDDLNVAEFEAFLEGCTYERYRSVVQAIEVLRSALVEYRTDTGDLLGWLGHSDEGVDYHG